MPAIDFEKVKRMVSMRTVLFLIDFKQVTQQGDELRGPCPVHRSTNARSRSFAASPKGWFCHSCKKNGDQLALFAAVRGLPLFMAVQQLCKEAGVEVPHLVTANKGRSSKQRNGEEER